MFADQACLDYDVTPDTATFKSCVSRATSAFDRGRRRYAGRSTGDANYACPSYRLSPEALGYRRCVATQIDPRMNRKTLIRFVPPAN